MLRAAAGPAALLTAAMPAFAQAQTTAPAPEQGAPPTRVLTLPPRKAATTTTIQFSLGLDYSAGKFGETQSTKVLSVPLGVKVADGAWTFRVSVPFVRLEGPGALILTNEAQFGTSNRGSTSSGSGTSSGSDSASTRSGSSGSGSNGNSGSGSSGSGGSSTGSGSSGSGGSGSSAGGGSSSGGGGSSGGSSGSTGGAASGATGGATSGATSGTAGNIVTTAGNATRVDTGIGDVVASVTYTLSAKHLGLYVDLTAKVKIPAASPASTFTA